VVSTAIRMSTHASNRPKRWKQALAAGAGGMLVIGMLAGTQEAPECSCQKKSALIAEDAL